MNAPAQLPPAAELCRAMPQHPGARADAIETALRVLGDEERRLGRMGLEGARERCRAVRRYWGFVDALVRMAGDTPAVFAPTRGAR